jgi:hypothetical protein
MTYNTNLTVSMHTWGGDHATLTVDPDGDVCFKIGRLPAFLLRDTALIDALRTLGVLTGDTSTAFSGLAATVDRLSDRIENTEDHIRDIYERLSDLENR